MVLPNHKQCFDRSLGFDLQERFSTDDFILVAGNNTATERQVLHRVYRAELNHPYN